MWHNKSCVFTLSALSSNAVSLGKKLNLFAPDMLIDVKLQKKILVL